LKGVDSSFAQPLVDSISTILHMLPEIGPELDLRRMHQITITSDFAGELAELSEANPSRNPMTHTKEDYGEAVAQVLLFRTGDDFKIVPVISAHVAIPLVIEDQPNYDQGLFRHSLHMLHHELCHVHDDNKKIDAFHDSMMKASYTGKDNYTMPLADSVWSEYIANKMSSSTADMDFIISIINSFAEAIDRTKSLINQEIVSYREHADLKRILNILQRHGDFLIKSAAYTLGYIDGMNKPLSEFSTKAAEVLSGSYFEKTWDAMHKVLQEMLKLYPLEWNGLKVYDALAVVIEEYYLELGFIISDMDDSRVYISIPFRPETA
jgi:hypothetical protein